MSFGHFLSLGVGFAISCYGVAGVLSGRIRARTDLGSGHTYTRRKNPRQFCFFVVTFVFLGIYIMYQSVS